MANRTGRGDKRSTVHWSWRDIFTEGSEELQEIVKIITGNAPPGVPVKEDTEHESN